MVFSDELLYNLVQDGAVAVLFVPQVDGTLGTFFQIQQVLVETGLAEVVAALG